MKKMKILVTGAAGFLGRYLLNEFEKSKRKNLEIVAFDKKVCKKGERSFKVFCGDVTNKEDIAKAIKRASTVIHLASVIRTKNKGDYLKVNVAGTKNLVEAAEKEKVSKFIFVSSSISSKDSRDLYAKSKHLAEMIIINSNLKCYYILRPTLLYGKGDTKNLAIIAKLPVFPVFGEGKQRLQPVYTGDLAKILVKIALSKKKFKKIFFVAGQTVAYSEILKAINPKKLRIHLPLLIGKLFARSKLRTLMSDKIVESIYIWNATKIKPMPFYKGVKNL